MKCKPSGSPAQQAAEIRRQIAESPAFVGHRPTGSQCRIIGARVRYGRVEVETFSGWEGLVEFTFVWAAQ